jgi:hypothetical protein
MPTFVHRPASSARRKVFSHPAIYLGRRHATLTANKIRPLSISS